MCLSGDETSSPTTYGILKTLSILISSHKKQRHSYEPTTSMELNRTNPID